MQKLKATSFILLFTAILLSQNIFAQSWKWARGANGITLKNIPGIAEGMDVAVDDSGNAYATGWFNYSDFIFGNDTLHGTNEDGESFLIKYDASGNPKWTVGQSDSGIGHPFYNAVDHFGNAYITGIFYSDSISFGAYTIPGDYTMARFRIKIAGNFLVKYNRNGKVLWAKKVGDSTYSVKDVCTDIYGNVFVVGSFFLSANHFGSVTLDNNYYNPFIGGNEAFIVKYDSSGSVIWAKEISGGDEFNEGITSDKLGNIYLTGFSNSPVINFGTDSLNNPNQSAVFLAKYDQSGNIIWAKCSQGSGYYWSTGIASDVLGNVCITGAYSGSDIVFGTDTLPLPNYTSPGNIFLVKYNSSGDVLWTTSATGGQSYSLAMDTSNIYLTGGYLSNTGYVFDTIQFDNYILQAPNPNTDPMFLANYNSIGNLLCATALSSGGDDQNAVAIGGQGEVYISGDYIGKQFIVGNDILREQTVADTTEQVFVARWQPCLSEEGIKQIPNPQTFSVYPNPADNTVNIDLNGLQNNNVELSLFNNMGMEIMHFKTSDTHFTISTVNLSPGLYFCKILAPGSVGLIQKIIVVH